MPFIHSNSLNQAMPILIAHMGNIDHRQRIGRLDNKNIAGLKGSELLAAS
jgi:hypothetical protein